MTKAELIEAMKDFPDDAIVYCTTVTTGYSYDEYGSYPVDETYEEPVSDVVQHIAWRSDGKIAILIK